MNIAFGVHVFWLAVFMAVSPTTGNLEDMSQKRRIYIFFEEAPISDSILFVKFESSTRDGIKESGFGEMIMPRFPDNDDLKRHLWFVDVSLKSYLLKLSVGPIGYEDLPPWSSMKGYEKIDGSSYVYHQLPDYTFQSDSSWRPIKLTMLEFSDFVLSRIDPYSKNDVNGCFTYDDLYNSFFSSLTDYSEEKAKEITWNDEYLGRKTNLYEKWNILKEEHSLNANKEEINFWPYLVGGSLLAISSAALVLILFYYGKKH